MFDENQYNEVNDDYEVKKTSWIECNDCTAEFEQDDITKNKVIAGLSYLWILFFLPLVACPNSKFGRFHANQSLILFITSTVYGIVANILGLLIVIFAWIPVLGWIVDILIGIITFALGIAILVLDIMGMVNAFTGKAKELPVIGKFKIIK